MPGGGGWYVSRDQLVGTAGHSPLSTVITQKKNPSRIKILSRKLIYFWINVSHFPGPRKTVLLLNTQSNLHVRPLP